jgi:F0F1-type ATP synthase membrane subunit b/b'
MSLFQSISDEPGTYISFLMFFLLLSFLTYRSFLDFMNERKKASELKKTLLESEKRVKDLLKSMEKSRKNFTEKMEKMNPPEADKNDDPGQS